MALIGNGNVSIDIARVLLKNPLEMQTTDIPTPVLNELFKSNIHNVEMVGRRGIVQSAFSIKEIRELSKIPQLKMYAFKNEVERGLNEESLLEMKPGTSPFSRGIKRRTEFL